MPESIIKESLDCIEIEIKIEKLRAQELIEALSFREMFIKFIILFGRRMYVCIYFTGRFAIDMYATATQVTTRYNRTSLLN